MVSRNKFAIHGKAETVAAGVPPAVEPVRPGGRSIKVSTVLENSSANPGGKMPPSTAGGTPAATGQAATY
jgi:hypothetical protein